MSATHPRAYDHQPASSSYGIHPSVSQDTYVYERSVSSKSDIYASSDDSDSTNESPSSVATNLSTVLSPDAAVPFQTLPHTPMTPPSSQPLLAEAGSLTPIPTVVHQLDTAVESGAGHAESRQLLSYPVSASHEKTISGTVSPPSETRSSGSSSTVSSSAPVAQERPFRQRTTSLGRRTRDSRSLYPPPAAYLHPDGINPEEWQPTDVLMPSRPGTDASNSSATRFALNDIESHSAPSSGDAGRDIYDQPDSRNIQLMYPPGLERYSNNLESIPSGSKYYAPHRRRSDGEQVPVTRPVVIEQVRSSSAPPTRCVRWNENLICPSPILPSQRRRGWFNRRGYAMYLSVPQIPD
jgi:hypothetical protein